MKLGDSEKSILVVLAGIAIAVLGFMYLIKPNYEETQTIKAECVQLQDRLTLLQQKEARRDEYLANTEKLNNAFQEKLDAFAPDLNQEVTIMFLEGIKDNNDFDIATLELGEPEQFYTLGLGGGDATLDATAGTTGTTEAASTEAASTEAASTEAATDATALAEGDAVDEAEYNCYRAAFPLEYTGSYASLKDVVKYVNDFESRMTIDSIEIAYDADSDLYGGALNLMLYAVTSSDRPETSMEMNDVEIGTDNIFQGAVGSGSSSVVSTMTKYDENEGAAIESSYDFYAMLNPASSDVSAKVVGQNGAGKEASVISNSDNDVTNLSFEFYEKDGKNYCKYTLGDSVSYEAEVTSAEDIKLLIQSSARKNDDDKVGVKVSIRNTTDLPVYVKVAGDDSVSPRVKIANKSGAVKVY
ncbi:MAG: hypothetical protein E7264_01870 [Lachnospiraceae bacterium]|nr:hypothetical protein [Lachnospiraceae bacterium]